MPTPVHVVCACNSGYIMPLSVMLASVAEHFDPARELVVHIVSNDATAADREKVRASLAMNRAGVEIHWYSYDRALLENIPVLSYFTPDVYSRLIAPALLPAECGRAVYLDCDVIVLADLGELFDAAGDEAMLHAAQDMATPFVSSELGVFDYRERGIPPETPYFNSGVMVLNVAKWRERDLTPALLDYLARNGRKVHAQDQGALNALLWNDRVLLDPRWNQGFDVLFPEIWSAAGHSREEWLRARNHPCIIHFSGHKKPWQAGRHGPRYSYFFRYLQKTVFKDTIPHRPYLEDVVGFRAYYQLWKWARKIPGLART